MLPHLTTPPTGRPAIPETSVPNELTLKPAPSNNPIQPSPKPTLSERLKSTTKPGLTQTRFYVCPAATLGLPRHPNHRHKRTLLSIPNHTNTPNTHHPHSPPTPRHQPKTPPTQMIRPSLRLDRDEQRQLAPLADLAAEVRAAGANGRLIRSDDVGRRLRRVFETETLELTARCEPGRHHRTRKLVSPTGTSAPWPAEDELHGRDAVVRCLSGNPPPAPPSYHAVRDGLLWRWIDCPG